MGAEMASGGGGAGFGDVGGNGGNGMPAPGGGGGITEGSPELKSYTNAIQAVLLMLIVPIFARVYHALGHSGAKHVLVSRIILFFISNLVLFALAYSAGMRIAIPFYVWLGIFSVMALAENRPNPVPTPAGLVVKNGTNRLAK